MTLSLYYVFWIEIPDLRKWQIKGIYNPIYYKTSTVSSQWVWKKINPQEWKDSCGLFV
jgi:hypothetical protein